MNNIEYYIRNVVDYALLTNDALNDNKITLVEYDLDRRNKNFTVF